MKKVLSMSLAVLTAIGAVTSAIMPLKQTVSAEGSGSTPISRPSYENYTFTEDFENGLDKWQEVYMKDGYKCDFETVNDPADETNKVLSFKKQSVFLVPLDEYWPEDAMIKSVSFKMRFKHNDFGLMGSYLTSVYQDNYNIMGWTMTALWNDTYGLWAKYRGRQDGDSVSAGGAPAPTTFDPTDWFTVDMTYSVNRIVVIFTDKNNNVVTATSSVTFPSGKFAVGMKNYATSNNENEKGAYYIDDISVSFQKSQVDTDEVQKDVNVYYSGNTFYEPGDTLSVIGEQLCNTVESVTAIKLPDTALSSSLSDARYINESNYENKRESNITWAELLEKAVSGSERSLKIEQRTQLGIKVVLPDDGVYSERGITALLLKSKNGGKDGIVIVNNPEISLLSCNDGDYATPNGSLKIAGYNLSVQDDASKVSAIISDKDGNNRILLDNSKLHIDTAENHNGKDNDYYLTVDLPDLPVGNYKIMLHNGYGGDLGWSMPKDFAVGAAPAYEKWETLGWFDVTSAKYGAAGNGRTNDTAAVISALNDAYKNGGGTVYFPAGYYRITDTLYIPENVTLKGKGTYQSCLFYDVSGLTEMPEAFIEYEDNFRMTDLYIYGSTTRSLIMENSTRTTGNGKWYFDNIKTMFDWKEYCSQGVGNLLEGYSALEAQLYLIAQSNGKGYNMFDSGKDNHGGKYLSFDNCDFYVNTSLQGKGNVFTAWADNVSANKTNWYGWSNLKGTNTCFLTDCIWQNGSYNWNGNTVIVDCEGKNVTSNNRELLTTDGASKYRNQTFQSLNNSETAAEVLAEEKAKLSENEYTVLENYLNDASKQGRLFRCITSKVYWNTDTASTMYVSDGQGAGQARVMENNILICGDYSYVTVEKPFAVDPNRNSKITVYGDRTQWFVLNSKFSNGRHVGTYGTMVDAVFDGLEFDHATSGIELQTNNGQIWYVTSKDVKADNIITGHTDVVEVKGSGLKNYSASGSALSYFGIQYRRNYVGEGGFYGFDAVSARKGTSEIIFEDNTFVSEEKCGFRNMTMSGDGIWIKGNKQYADADLTTEAQLYDTFTVNKIRQSDVTRYGSYSVICDDYLPSGLQGRIYGDVNNDGKVSIKDVTVLRYYLAGITDEETLVESYGKDALKYADCDGVSGVDSRDIFEIYKYLLNPDAYKGAVGKANAPEPDPEPVEITVYNDNVRLDYSSAEEEGTDPANPRVSLDYSNAAECD